MTTSPRTDPVAGAHQPGSGAGARNHHHVPQCYLRVKGFANSYGKDAQLYVVDMVRWHAFTTTPPNVAACAQFASPVPTAAGADAVVGAVASDAAAGIASTGAFDAGAGDGVAGAGGAARCGTRSGSGNPVACTRIEGPC
nr:DUF4238 domain-containing protein [Ralstonia solanacearum]